jgi:hypothetical protein
MPPGRQQQDHRSARIEEEARLEAKGKLLGMKAIIGCRDQAGAQDRAPDFDFSPKPSRAEHPELRHQLAAFPSDATLESARRKCSAPVALSAG